MRIAVLDIAVDIKTLDLTNEGVLHDLGFEHESRAWNYAQAFQEVLLHRCIEAKEIKYVHCITNPAESLPNSRMALNSFREFRSFTKRVVILENSFPDNELIESVLQIHETKVQQILDWSLSFMDHPAPYHKSKSMEAIFSVSTPAIVFIDLVWKKRMDEFIHDEVSRRHYIQFGNNSRNQTLDASIYKRLEELECKKKKQINAWAIQLHIKNLNQLKQF